MLAIRSSFRRTNGQFRRWMINDHITLKMLNGNLNQQNQWKKDLRFLGVFLTIKSLFLRNQPKKLKSTYALGYLSCFYVIHNIFFLLTASSAQMKIKHLVFLFMLDISSKLVWHGLTKAGFWGVKIEEVNQFQTIFSGAVTILAN